MRVVVVGAGLAGLLAGRWLQASGHDVVLLDKGRSPGGRLATRRIGPATLDHGAQFFTVRSDAFAALVEAWLDEGVVREWCRGFGPARDGHPRYVGVGGMNALAKHLARPLSVRTATMAFAVRRRASGWHVALDDGAGVDADAVLLTCPVPQALSLLVTADVELPEALRTTDYDRTVALLAVLDEDGAVPDPGGVQQPDDVFSWIGDNRAKGLSAAPALTFHAGPSWSRAHWDADPADTLDALHAAAAPWLGSASLVEAQLKRWRFATPCSTWPDPCWVAPDAPTLVLAGDAFAGPKAEGAALSGLAAADALTG